MQFFELCEILMLVCFGFSWPINAVKSLKARTAKGKSLTFLIFILCGYIAGITGKLINPNGFKWYVLFFYFFNAFFVAMDTVLYFRNKKLDREKELAESAE